MCCQVSRLGFQSLGSTSVILQNKQANKQNHMLNKWIEKNNLIHFLLIFVASIYIIYNYYL